MKDRRKESTFYAVTNEGISHVLGIWHFPDKILGGVILLASHHFIFSNQNIKEFVPLNFVSFCSTWTGLIFN